MKAGPLNDDYAYYENSGTSNVVWGCLMVVGALAAIPVGFVVLFVGLCLLIRVGNAWEDARRLNLGREIDRLVTSARKQPDNERYGRALLEIARRDESYDSSRAAEAMAGLGEAARPIVPEIAVLLRDDDHWVRMSTARSLAKLGPISEEALPELVMFVRSRKGDDSGMSDAIRAIARIGEPSIKALPMLRGKLAQNDSRIEGDLKRAIEYLEALERGDINAVYDDGCSCCRPSKGASEWPSSSDEKKPDKSHSVLEV